jgi:hypothetical protein
MAARSYLLRGHLRLPGSKISSNPQQHVFSIFAGLPGLFWATLSHAATNSELVDEIPGLRPPRGEIPPTFLDRYGVWIVIAAILIVYVAAMAVWLLTRKAKTSPLPPEIQARQALRTFDGRPEDGRVISEISRVVRRYFTAAFDLPRQELTTAEFSRVLMASESIGAELADRIASFLRECDQRKFDIGAQTPPATLPSAIKLIESGEARRQYLREEQKRQEAASHAR